MKRSILVLISILFSMNLLGQNQGGVSFSAPDKNSSLMDLAKILFLPEKEFSFNISTKDTKQSYAEIESIKVKDEKYLNQLIGELKKDSLNPFYLKDIADYYTEVNQTKLAKQYYSKAYKNLNTKFRKPIKDMSKDSASYYSFRGLLKLKLSDTTTALSDFKKAVQLKPTDSIALIFYPILLIEKGKLKEADSYIKRLIANSECATVPYIWLIINETFNKLPELAKLKEKESISKSFKERSYDEILDFKILDSYASKCKANQEIQNARVMADILGLFAKLASSGAPDNSEITNYNDFKYQQWKNLETIFLNINDYEMNKLHEIIKILALLETDKKLNDYSLFKCYGFVYFMLRDWEKTIFYFNEAIRVFPTEKGSKDFNLNECYGNLGLIYLQKSDTLNFRKLIHEKIANESDIKNTLDDQIKLANDYYLNGDIHKAEGYCRKVREINPDHFDALRLLAHINILKGSKLPPIFQLDKARRYVNSNTDAYNLLMQYAIYQIYNGDIKTAKGNIEKAREINGGGDCALCDKLLADYCNDK
ncbi:tetratricopeptide repeat protein [Seonamhaeicola aphaedonensis]|uniref:Tetratricopeptide repeat protein n=1 Tax=Seonamhaeicola aphaedonensis TaxID=1461338 RepID=A0A3D9HKF4_9FLAO|nr:hypothetical protein [Seonamhaeicola aphaedonensis]RED49992.1 hypothetical protein DFQ02_10112 [Seonamhaeicola aphaedonensis]